MRATVKPPLTPSPRPRCCWLKLRVLAILGRNFYSVAYVLWDVGVPEVKIGYDRVECNGAVGRVFALNIVRLK